MREATWDQPATLEPVHYFDRKCLFMLLARHVTSTIASKNLNTMRNLGILDWRGMLTEEGGLFVAESNPDWFLDASVELAKFGIDTSPKRLEQDFRRFQSSSKRPELIRPELTQGWTGGHHALVDLRCTSCVHSYQNPRLKKGLL